MTGPIFPPVDPATGALPAATEARYAKPVDLTGLAPKASPVFTGVPSAPTAATTTNTQQIATTAFVQTELSALPTSTVEEVQDIVNTLVVAGSGITKTYDDTANTLTLSSATVDAEFIRDTVAAAIVAGTRITVTVDDTADTITVATSATANSTDAVLLDRANHTGVQTISTVTDLQTTLDSLQSQIDVLKGGKIEEVNWSTGGAGWGTYNTVTTVTRNFSSTNDIAATPPTFYSAHDKWFAHKDYV